VHSGAWILYLMCPLLRSLPSNTPSCTHPLGACSASIFAPSTLTHPPLGSLAKSYRSCPRLVNSTTTTSISAVAERPCDASCLQIVSFNSIPEPQSFITVTSASTSAIISLVINWANKDACLLQISCVQYTNAALLSPDNSAGPDSTQLNWHQLS